MFSEKIKEIAATNTSVSVFVKKDGAVIQSVSLMPDAKKEGNFYLQGRDAQSQPVEVFSGIFEKAANQGLTIEIF